jgi:hypothetical protein
VTAQKSQANNICQRFFAPARLHVVIKRYEHRRADSFKGEYPKKTLLHDTADLNYSGVIKLGRHSRIVLY